MPRYCCLVDAEANGSFRSLTGNTTAVSNVPVKVVEWREHVPGEPPPSNEVPPGMAPLHRFDAHDREQAEQYFRRMQREGCPTRWDIVGNAGTDSTPGARPWRFRDGYHHARESLRAATVPANAEGAVRACPQYKAIGSLLGQVNDLYHRSRKQDGVAVLTPQDFAGVSHSLRVCEEALATMALMVAAGCDMLDPAYPALGIPHARRYRVAIDHDPAPDAPQPTDTQPPRRPKPAPAAK